MEINSSGKHTHEEKKRETKREIKQQKIKAKNNENKSNWKTHTK